MKIGVQAKNEKKKKRREIHVQVPCKLPKKEPLPSRRVSLVKPYVNPILRVASSIDMDDFEPSEEEEEEEEIEEIEEEEMRRKEKRKKNRRGRDLKWYADFVNFQSKRREIEHLLKDNARRGSILPPSSGKESPQCLKKNSNLARAKRAKISGRPRQKLRRRRRHYRIASFIHNFTKFKKVQKSSKIG